RITRYICRNREISRLRSKLQSSVFRIDADGLAFADFAFQDVDAERVENFFLNGAAQRTRAVNGIVTFARQQLLGRIRELECDLLLLQAFRQAAQLDFHNLFQIVLAEPIENDDFFDSIEE